jgi:hypothetical protein
MPARADNVGVSGSAPLIGRGLALAGLRAALDGALAGHGSLVLIAGEAGIGKTALAARFAGQAAACGVPVAWGSCAEGDGAPAFWPWTQVLRATGGLAEGRITSARGLQRLMAGRRAGRRTGSPCSTG